MPKSLKKEQMKGLAIWTVILIVVAIVVVGVVTLSFVFSKKFHQRYIPTPEAEKPSSEEKTSVENKPEIFEYEPGSITILQGTIKEIVNNTLTVEVAENEKNPALKGKSFQVLMDDQTKIIWLEGGFYATKRGDQTEITMIDLFSREEKKEKTYLTFSDLKIDDFVIVLSFSDIKDKDSFIAKEIYKR